MKKIILLSVVIFCSSFVLRSETYNLDLQKSIDIAKQKSFNMLSLMQEFKIAEYNLKSATSRLKTHIDLNLVSPNFTQTLYKDQDSTGVLYYPVKQSQYQSYLTFSQPLPTNGSISVTSAVENINDFHKNYRSFSLNSRINFTQPLDALYGYNKIKSELKKAELAYEQMKKGLKREELTLVYQVSNSFYNLLSVQKGTEIARLDYDRQKEAYDISQKKLKAGLIKEVDALQMEVDLAEAQNNYDLANVHQGAALNEFKQLIGLNFNDSVSLSNELKYDVVIIDPEKAVQYAFQNRLEIREQEIQIEISNLNIKEQKSAGMIKANLNAYYEKIGVSWQSTSTTLSSSAHNSYSDFVSRAPNYGVGFTVKIPLLDFGENKALVNAAKSRLKQNQLKKEDVQRGIEREVRNLVADLNSSLKRLQLLEKNIAIAEKSFAITRQRYSDGDTDSQSLALERKRLNNAYTSHLSAYVSYQLLLADIMRKTFYDFQNNQLIK